MMDRPLSSVKPHWSLSAVTALFDSSAALELTLSASSHIICWVETAIIDKVSRSSLQESEMLRIPKKSFRFIAVSVLVDLVCALAPSIALAQSSGVQTLDLSSGWQFRQTGSSAGAQSAAWLPASVPGNIHLDLLRNKVIPAPFYRNNEAKLQWIETAGWEYRTTVSVNSALLLHKNIDLVFEGLDTVATVSLNGHALFTANNMFRAWRADVKPYLHAGANELLVEFPAADSAAAAAASGDPSRALTQTAAKTYVRKAAYEYGWDWGPTFVTSGIWQPVKLMAWDDAHISNIYIRQRDVSSQVAHLDADIEVTAADTCTCTVALSMTSPSGTMQEFSRSTLLAPGINHIAFPIEIAHPELWFPAGYGAHPLYSFRATLRNGVQTEDEAAVRTGLRSIELRRLLDQWGRSFEFVVNGIPVFAKGADVIPFDSFPNRVTDTQMRGILQSAVDANMNMVRVWGGGYYQSGQFYDMCDELGLMVWQDFMFGNEWQPGIYSFRQSVHAEVDYQVRRLRNHPSIVLWCGNNETEISWDWDRMKAVTAQLSADTRRRMWQDYLVLFSGDIPQEVERLDPETPYWPSSPSADYENVSDTYQSGDMHDWSVWHGRAPFSDYDQHFPRFMSEYGFQSFPEMRTIEAFTLPEDRTSIFTPVMLAHQKNDEGNAIIRDYLLRYYGEPKDFPSFLYASQVLQAEGVKVGAEHLRRIMPRAMGSLYWQLNDCWPVASWSSIDYYGRWKALQYYARRFYNPLLISPTLENGAIAVYVVSDKLAPVNSTIRLRLMSLSGQTLRDTSEAVTVAPLTSKAYLQIPLEEVSRAGIDSAKVFVAVSLIVNGAEVSSNLLYLVPTAQIALPHPDIREDLIQVEGGYQLRLTSSVLARSVYVSFGDEDVQLSDNYVDLLPNEPVTLILHSAADLTRLQKAMSVVSLGDAFSKKAVASGTGMVPANPDWK